MHANSPVSLHLGNLVGKDGHQGLNFSNTVEGMARTGEGVSLVTGSVMFKSSSVPYFGTYDFQIYIFRQFAMILLDLS